ncbi:MAG TPA: EamA family transporter [Actinophytocola sp.]|nr:EamA family transporter [Actinophytocola sp.]
MGALFALASSVLYGVADFAGGVLSRRAGFAPVALVGQASGLVLMLVVAPLVPGTPTVADLGWGALSGVGTGVGMLFLYRGMSRGAMSVVVPVAAVGGLAVPALFGIALLGDRPTVLALAGMVLAVPTLWLVTRDGGTGSGGVADGLLASVFIAVQYLALALAAPAAGLWPVLAGRVTATLALVPLAGRPPTDRRVLLGAAATGACATLALVAYLLATRAQLLSIAVVLSSLYPAIPVVLGLTVLRERLTRPQLAGLLGASAAIALLTLG